MECLTHRGHCHQDLRLWPDRTPPIEHGLDVMVMSTSFLPRRSQSAVQTSGESPMVLRVTLVILDLFVGIGGIFGGLEMIRDPVGAALGPVVAAAGDLRYRRGDRRARGTRGASPDRMNAWLMTGRAGP